MTGLVVPPAFAARAALGPAWADWLDALPRLVRDLLGEWDLKPDGDLRHGETALAVPVRTSTDRAAILKVTWPHWEAETEHVALQRWHGGGAVELLRADPRRLALLLERAHHADLTTVPDDAASEIVGRLYRRLHVPATPQLRTLTSQVAEWTDRLAALPRDAPVPHRFVQQAVSLGRAFTADPATDGTLVHTDLHHLNVLAAEREPWLAIDPKPLSGDPHYEVAPMLWNRWDEAVASDLRGRLRRRMDVLTETGELDHERTRDWVVFRMMCNALWAIEDAAARPGGLTAEDHRWFDVSVAVVKAVLD
ncbi:aminoglycoside resistance protein [Actinotalea ferrariae]|uniref:aminoglycoside phosphotransferase family protein n=1 Tax=Actinotalea ferrariae TaxID=1386098 RepID=UPI001C8C9613|nr:aminoglycoside phosphotransferase family protein [Actinotalea ferrariae]MBX9244326.1 aminoglycoside resistance protein [Actinotalea ferrariae]